MRNSFKLIFRWANAKGKGYPLSYDFTTEENRNSFIINNNIEVIEAV